MYEPWQSEPEMQQPARDPIAWAPYDAIDALRDLGVLKSTEHPRVMHAYGCPFPKDYSARCGCPGGPEVMWPDWDERERPVRHYVIPERFHARR